MSTPTRIRIDFASYYIFPSWARACNERNGAVCDADDIGSSGADSRYGSA